MPSPLQHRAWSISHWFIGIFLALFVFRFIYGFALPDAVQGSDRTGDFFSGIELRKNYASEKFSMKGEGGGSGVQASAFASSQKYEKTATTRSRSTAFEKDNALLDRQVKAFNGVVQYEQRSGNPGDRQLHLLIGVVPEKFDTFYTAVQSIGRVRFTEITKVDKTNEYRQLNAKKTSLEKTLVSLNELKAKGGEITDFIALHEKIRDIESELQTLGVDLGNFDSENEFCSVRFSLYEGVAGKKIGVMQRINVALEWTLQFYALAIVCIVGISLASLLVVVLVEKLRRMMTSAEKTNV